MSCTLVLSRQTDVGQQADLNKKFGDAISHSPGFFTDFKGEPPPLQPTRLFPYR